VVKPTEPPEAAVPETIRNDLLSCVVDFVHPVGAAVCIKVIAVPAGKALGDAPFDAAVNRPLESTVIEEYVYEPADTAVFASVVELPTDVTSPVKLAFVVTLPAVKLAAVPVRLVPAPAKVVAVNVPVTVNGVFRLSLSILLSGIIVFLLQRR
jgi:hypothetical protein